MRAGRRRVRGSPPRGSCSTPVLRSGVTPKGPSAAGPARRAMRRLRGPWILRPRVLRVAAAQLLADLGIGLLPERAQVAGGLHGTPVRRQKLEHHGLAARTEAWRLGETEQLLKLDRG